MRIAIVTGASSGLGAEYVRRIDAKGYADEIWAIARREERLRELAGACKTPVRCIPADLCAPGAIADVRARLAAAALTDADFTVSMLVNAAGLGKFGCVEELSADETAAMVDLNCRALVEMTQAVLPHMGRGSRIVQIASSAAFQPLQGLAVYAASKSFVLSFTRALRRELAGRGIYVTAVCPIWVKTEFVKVARDTANGQTVKHPWPQLSPGRVVAHSDLVNRCNYPVATCSLVALCMRVFCKLAPAPLVMWLWEGIRRI